MSIPRIVVTATVGIVLLFAGVVGLTIRSDNQRQTPQITEAPAVSDLTPENFLKEVNEERQKAGVAPLRIDPLLNKSAQLKADELQRTKVFEHVNPEGKHGYEYITEVGVQGCTYISENLAAFSGNTESTVKGWFGSKPHREAMLDPRYDTTGFGAAGEYRVEHFCDLP